MNRDRCGICDAPCELCKCEALGALTETHKELERALEYELWGVVTGGGGIRQMVHQINPNEIWPAGTALYVCKGVKE